MSKLIALTGYARAGKDVFASALIERGYTRYNFGDTIKAFYAPFIGGQEDWMDLLNRIVEHRSAGVTREQVYDFARAHLVPYAFEGRVFSAFTEVTEDKARFRSILEEGGELVYDHVLSIYLSGLDELLAGGARVVNTRVGFNTVTGRSPEAEALRDRGAQIIEIEREGWSASTTWDRQANEGLHAQGLITRTLRNAAASGEEWAADAAIFADDLLEDEMLVIPEGFSMVLYHPGAM